MSEINLKVINVCIGWFYILLMWGCKTYNWTHKYTFCDAWEPNYPCKSPAVGIDIVVAVKNIQLDTKINLLLYVADVYT